MAESFIYSETSVKLFFMIHTNKCTNVYIKIFYKYSYRFQCFYTILRES